MWLFWHTSPFPSLDRQDWRQKNVKNPDSFLWPIPWQRCSCLSISLWEPRNSGNYENLKFQSLIKKFETIWSNRFLVSIHSHGARLPGSCPGSIIYCCVTLGKLLDFSMPQFPYLWNRNNNSKLDKVFVRIVRHEFTKNWNIQ